MEVTCSCQEWSDSFPQIKTAQITAYYDTSLVYTGSVMKYCPWCGKELSEKEPETEDTEGFYVPSTNLQR